VIPGGETDRIVLAAVLDAVDLGYRVIVALLERQIGRLENYPEMADRMRQHLEESKQQAARIEKLLAGLNTSHSTLKDMVPRSWAMWRRWAMRLHLMKLPKTRLPNMPSNISRSRRADQSGHSSVWKHKTSCLGILIRTDYARLSHLFTLAWRHQQRAAEF
jgi:hypothetical protein